MSVIAPLTTPLLREQVEFSPFDEDRVAIATAQHFGLVGNGRLHVVHRTAVSGELSEVYCAFEFCIGFSMK